MGNALASNGGFYSVLTSVPVGERWATMDATLHNVSNEPMTITGISVTGQGVGSVIEITDMRMAPVPANHDSLKYTSGGVFRTYPPVLQVGVECAVQVLRPVKGFVLRPDAVARALLLTRALAPGTFMFRGIEVSYTQGGQARTEVVDFGQRGTVVEKGPPQPPLAGDERRCARFSKVLPSGQH